MIATKDLPDILGAKVLDRDDDKIGTVSQVYVDPVDDHPTWVSVKTGLFGSHESFVPIEDATWDHEALHVPCDKDQVKDAPRIEPEGALTAEEQDDLYAYYGMGDDHVSGDAATDSPDRHNAEQQGNTWHRDPDPVLDRDDEPDRNDARAEALREKRAREGEHHDDRGDLGDRHDLGDRGDRGDSGNQGETRQPRLRKYVVTEEQYIRVPVTREEYRVEDDSEGDGRHRA